MRINELDAKVATYFDILAKIDALTAEAEAIEDVLKFTMAELATDELGGTGWRATWRNTTTTRFDSKRFKADYADLYGAYTKKTTGTRFTLNRLNT